MEAYYDTSLYPWDFAAATLVASEAGAHIFSLKTKTLDTNKKSDILVANSNIVDKFVKWISTGKL
jgi:fructose-1,6-bisphosphatase/inositol monophosphatase family enzyme